jgi:hypothetical protein
MTKKQIAALKKQNGRSKTAKKSRPDTDPEVLITLQYE